MFDAIVIGLVLYFMGHGASAKTPDVYVVSPRLVSQSDAAKELAKPGADVYACQKLGLKVTAKVVKVRGPKVVK